MFSKFDEIIYNFLVSIMNPNLTVMMKIITHLASTTTFILLIIAILILIKNKKNSRLTALNLILVFLLSAVLKNIFRRTRPSALPLVTTNGFSFPSGHTMVATGVYGFFIYLAYKGIKNKRFEIFCNINFKLIYYFYWNK